MSTIVSVTLIRDSRINRLYEGKPVKCLYIPLRWQRFRPEFLYVALSWKLIRYTIFCVMFTNGGIIIARLPLLLLLFVQKRTTD